LSCGQTTVGHHIERGYGCIAQIAGNVIRRARDIFVGFVRMRDPALEARIARRGLCW